MVRFLFVVIRYQYLPTLQMINGMFLQNSSSTSCFQESYNILQAVKLKHELETHMED